VSLARESGAERPSAAGHSLPASVSGRIVLDPKDMRQLDLDVDRRTAWAEPVDRRRCHGCRRAHGLATFGDTALGRHRWPDAGGGVGYLAEYGPTIDSLLAAEMVTADGRCCRWAGHTLICSGDPGRRRNLGVATGSNTGSTM
jgi:hypothetical protein